ncbi:MAG TPA: choice-of-anchor I family protein [Candidatus Scatovicinus merdipullorum]|nr:choice-of-anchor I family protein [Candidatus Scatovicinus merdipullorum]
MKVFWKQKLLSGVLAATMAASAISGGMVAVSAAEEPSSGTPYAAGGTFLENSFEEHAPLTMERLSSIQIGEPNPDGAVAEIVAYNADRKEAYVVNGQDGLLYRFSVEEAGLTETGSEDMRGLVDGFAYGDMTSVAVDTVNDHIAVALQAAGYADNGRIVLLDYDFNLLAAYEVGVQPDMVTFSHDGRLVLSANEGEPREGYGEGTIDPAGSVSIIDLMEESVTTAGFEEFDSAELAEQGVLIGKVDGKMNEAAVDLEPEYIAVSADDSKAYVSLQEANAIATVDLKSMRITAVKSMGFKDLSDEKNAIDLVEDGTYQAKTYPNALGVYMPDALSIFEANGSSYLVTANEGDAREWGDYVNEAKETLLASDGTEAEKVRVLDKDLTAVPDESKEYLYGGRSFAIYNADTMELVYESGNDFEEKTAAYLPNWFNCSNDDIELDSRSAKKGPEAESVAVGQIGEKTYAFIALERIGGVMVYDVTDPADAAYVNYINTRDFSEDIKEDVSPEGLCFLSINGKPLLLAACEVSGTVAAYSFAGTAVGNVPEEPGYDPMQNDAVILYTNDVHCAMEDYAAFASYRQQMLDAGYRTVTIDAGDAVQGEVIGTLTNGTAIVEIMNAVGYDYAVPGNHEFDYGMDVFKELSGQVEADIMPEYEYLSANFVDLQTNKTVFKPYEIRKIAGQDVAFVGISTPETYTKSTPAYFQDENGNYIYSFCEGSGDDTFFYDTIQAAVDNAIEEGADLVIAVGHLGTDAASEPWRSTDVIANTTGIDAFIDAHSHSTIEEQLVDNKNGEDVVLTSTGTKFENFGKMTISEDGTIVSELLKPEEVDIDATASAEAAYDQTQEVIDKYEELQQFTYEEVGFSEVNLTTVDPETGDRIIRNQETNMGNFVADAYRATTGADIAFANGGGIRADVARGTVIRKDLMDVNAFGNTMCVLEVTGQQILDALEWSAHAPLNEDGTALTENGGFMHTAGLTYEINLHVQESPVLTDSQGVFTGIDESKPRRVQNVEVNGEIIDPEAIYTLAGSAYTLCSGGDGYTMFQDAKVVAADCGKDQDLLIAYLQEDLNGTIPADLYGNPYGEGRIKILTTGAEEAHRYVETERVEATAEQDGYVKYVCSICGEEKTEVMPKLSGEEEKTEVLPEQPGKEGSPSFPETGANIPIVCFALLLGAAAVIGGLGAWKRKSGKSV